MPLSLLNAPWWQRDGSLACVTSDNRLWSNAHFFEWQGASWRRWVTGANLFASDTVGACWPLLVTLDSSLSLDGGNRVSVEAILAGTHARDPVVFGASLDLLAVVAPCLHFRLVCVCPCSARLLALIRIEVLCLCCCCVCPGAATSSLQASLIGILFKLTLVVVRGPGPWLLAAVCAVFGASITHKNSSPLHTVARPTVGCTSLHLVLMIKTFAC